VLLVLPMQFVAHMRMGWRVCEALTTAPVATHSYSCKSLHLLTTLPTFQVAKALPVLCVKFHEDVQALSARFLAEQRRHYYMTPTSYLELLGSYKKLLAKRQDEVRHQWFVQLLSTCLCSRHSVQAVELGRHCRRSVCMVASVHLSDRHMVVCCAFPQVMTAKKRYEVGLSKLATTESSVTGMQVSCGVIMIPLQFHCNRVLLCCCFPAL
jgi:hypothetical protein